MDFFCFDSYTNAQYFKVIAPLFFICYIYINA